MRPPAWTPPPAEIRELQALLRRLENLQEMQRMEQNREATADPAVKGSIQAVLATLDKEIEAVRRHIGGSPGLRQRAGLLESIPGVGETTAAWLLTLLAEHRGFDDPKQAVAFAGLAPRLRQSGQWAGQTKLCPRPAPPCCVRRCTCRCCRP